MKVPQRVVWTEGMFMAPQHMQQLDKYHEALISARLGALVPFDWGVEAVQIDQRALAAGQLRVQKFTGVLPDGLPISFDEAHPELPPARPIEGHFAPTQRALEVFLGVPNEREGVANYASDPNARQGVRYLVATKTVYDSSSGAAEQSVAFAQRNVVILFGDEPRDAYEAIKIAEIVRDAGGAMVVREDYVPPCRKIGGSPFIIGGMRKVLSLMAARWRKLADSRRQRDAASVEYGPADVTRFLMLNAISTFTPLVNYLIDTGNETPENAYLLLSQFAGQLCTFSADADPTTLPKFNYQDLGGTYSELYARISALLAMTDKDRFISVPLESRDDGLHFGRLEDERLVRSTVFVLVVASQIPEGNVVDQLPKLSKIASWGEITDIVGASTPGVPLQVTYRPPPEIPVKAGMVYFALVTSDRYWRSVLNERTIAIYLPPPFDPTRVKLELLAVPPPDGR